MCFGVLSVLKHICLLEEREEDKREGAKTECPFIFLKKAKINIQNMVKCCIPFSSFSFVFKYFRIKLIFFER